ncbi:MAG: hypothetical protein IJV75_00345 [Alphaproteobacteria bacterium]|nr:hypothetical protein [Alphaproteobacteria bacterium]
MSNESVRLITKAQLDEYKKLETENEELKNLLKRCKPMVGFCDCLSPAEFDEKRNVLTKIDEVLK